MLENMVTFGAACNRDWEDTFQSASAAGYKTGATINIKRPPRYTYRAGRVASPQDTVEKHGPADALARAAAICHLLRLSARCL